MNYNRPVKNDSTLPVMVMCAVVFVAFTFLWIYYFQADVLTVSQHVLSGGRTTYNPFVGAVLVTVVLWLLQLIVNTVVRLQKSTHALTYFPSMLGLAILTSVSQKTLYHFTLGHWYWIAPLLLLLWGAGVWVARQIQPYEEWTPGGFFSRRMWVNMTFLVLMMFFVTLVGNTNAVFHYRTHVETALMAHDYDEALRVGNESLETDSSLMMVRMYALSREGQLGERLFDYPLVPSSDAMLPTAGAVDMLLYPIDSLYRHLGAIPRRSMQPMEYLKAIIRSGQAKPAAADYLLCGYLIDKDLDAFARTVDKYYAIDESLPRHYREALVLYTHLRSHPVIIYHDPILDVDYEDLQKLEAQYTLDTERKGKVMEQYANCYWYYYEYVGKPRK